MPNSTFSQTKRLHTLVVATRCGAVTFIGISGVLGMVLIYAPDEVISALYRSAALSAAVAAIGRWIVLSADP